MAQFPGLRLTQQGNQMIIRSTSGRESDQLIVTKAILGDGNLTSSIEGMTNIVSPKLNVSLTNMSNGENGTRVFKFEFDNKTVNTGFYWREVGVYAKNGQNGQEKLIAYSNASGLTSYIPDKNSPIPMQSLQVAIAVGDSTNVAAQIDLGVSVSRADVETLINTHKADANAHGLEKYAGGTTIPSNIRNWNDLTKPGIYECNAGVLGWSNAPSSSKIYPYGQIHVTKTEGNVITQTFYSHGQGKAIKQASRTFYVAWGAWQYFGDWENTITGIAKHNEGINVTKGDATELIKLITNNKSDSNTLLAPTLSVVKSLIGDVNIDVPSILKSKGVRYDFSNENAWYICFGEAFGGLIIQGGTTASIYDTKVDINYPISFKSKVLWGGVTIDHSGISSGGLAAYFQSADLKRGKVTSDAISDAFTADIKYIVIGY
ncbi:pyocin knob domain-containing protein [Veillonella sp. 3913]|uniref:pyocin knob domain-containing protein n=1 Tax=Veillonella sp. 3913 TaxID=2490952 RepID=UPI000F8EC74C|nr:pyocin knob domain-containing protein [Veillonella sp. 3913]